MESTTQALALIHGRALPSPQTPRYASFLFFPCLLLRAKLSLSYFHILRSQHNTCDLAVLIWPHYKQDDRKLHNNANNWFTMILNKSIFSLAFIAKQSVLTVAAWWFSEIKSMFPPQLAALVWKPKAVLVLVPAEKEIAVSFSVGTKIFSLPNIMSQPSPTEVEKFWAILRSLESSSFKTIIDLDEKRLLISHGNYPLAAEANLGKILLNEIDRLTPFTDEQVYWDWNVLTRNYEKGRLSIEIAVARRTLIDSLLSCIHAYGISPVAVRRCRPHVSNLFNHLLPQRHANPLRRKYVLNFWLNIIVLFMLLLLVFSFMYYVQRQERLLATSLQDIEPAVAELERTKRHLELLNDVASTLEAQGKRPTNLAILETITRLMPDDVWIFDLQLNDGKARMSGFAQDPSALIELVDSDSHFSDAKFLSPVTSAHNGSGQRFDMSFCIKSSGAQ